VKRHLAITLIVTSCVLPLRSATLERLSLDDLIVKSTAIVRATVSDTWTAMSGRDIRTYYKLQVSERFKGPAQDTIEIITPGGTVGDLHQSVAGSPVLNKGDDFVFFLWTSGRGVTWITGLTQGLFSLPGGAGDDPVATRAANRELTLDAVSGRPVKDAVVSMKLSALRTRIAATLGEAGVR
jgi:hypothetical protein